MSKPSSSAPILITMGEPAGIVEKELTIHVSNLAHIDPQSRKPTRVGYKKLEDGRKVRVARRSGTSAGRLNRRVRRRDIAVLKVIR